MKLSRFYIEIQIPLVFTIRKPIFPGILRIDIPISPLFPHVISSSKWDADKRRSIAHLDNFMLFKRLAFVLLGTN